MIKIGCNYLSLRDVPIEAFIRTSYELGLDTVDFHRRAFKSADPEYLRKIKLMCWKYGLPIGYIGSSGGFVGSEKEIRDNMAEVREAIDLASFVGAPIVRIFGGHLSQEVKDRESIFRVMVRCMKDVTEYGARKGVIVALQNHDNNNLASTADEMLRIMKDTDHPNFSLVMDTGQWKGSIGAGPKGIADPKVDIYKYMEQVLPHSIYVRTKFYRNEGGKEEWIDYRKVVGILKAAGYNGNLSIVYEGDDEDRVDAVRRAALELRRLIAEG